jgi:hypothetical protein
MIWSGPPAINFSKSRHILPSPWLGEKARNNGDGQIHFL